MAKKYNNGSNDIKEWTNKKLKEYATSLYELIYGEVSCYGRSDLFMYSNVLKELDNRGITPKNRLEF